MERSEIQQLIDRDNLGPLATVRYEAEAWLSTHPEYFVTRANGEKMTGYMAEHGIELNAEGFEQAYRRLKQAGEILPARESLAKMSADELKAFVREHGEPVTDSWGRTTHEIPSAYTSPASSEGFVRPRQGTVTGPSSV